MTRRNRILAWAIVVFAIVTVAFVTGRLFPPPAPETAEAPAIDPHTGEPVPWTFEWAEGDIRGTDVPRHVIVGNKRVPIRHLGDVHSAPGEDKIAFLQRVRAQLVDFSRTTRYEGCGEICGQGDALAIRLTTNDATRRCAIAPICPPGFSSVRESIHSHCPSGRSKATLSDELLTNGELRRGKPAANCDSDRFSQLDFRGRKPGWLAGRVALHRHEGPEKLASFGEPINGPAVVSAP